LNKEKINTIKIKWQNPLSFAKKVADNYDLNWTFLYSGLNDKVKESFSYIALFPKEEIISQKFEDLEKTQKSENLWFGYLSYEAGKEFENIEETRQSYINLPNIWLINFSLIIKFDHTKKEITISYRDQNQLNEVINYKSKNLVKERITIETIDSNFSDQSYLEEISNIRKMIADGAFYQTNLTRKFFGKLKIKDFKQKNYFNLFKKLNTISPANYSSFLRLNNNYIISASPELFIKIDDKKQITSQPIKGTTPRSEDISQDKKNKLYLVNSEKEKAENLMIVDLVRNDLSRVCKANSVKVSKLFEITSYKTIHHMSSTIIGKIDNSFNNIDAIQACFPAGSMTGAPKIKAMEVIAKKEKMNRGVYSGAIGFIGKKEINLSVVIRTLICQGSKFEFQSGGGITYDSNEKKELEEIFNKTKAISKLLNLDIKF